MSTASNGMQNARKARGRPARLLRVVAVAAAAVLLWLWLRAEDPPVPAEHAATRSASGGELAREEVRAGRGESASGAEPSSTASADGEDAPAAGATDDAAPDRGDPEGGVADEPADASAAGERGPTAPRPAVVLRTRHEIEFSGGGSDWRPIYARVSSMGGSLTASFPGVERPRGFLVEPADTRSPDERERNLPRGRPRLVCTTLDWEAAAIDSVRIQAAFVEDGPARVYFRRAGDEGFADENHVEVPVTGSTGLAEWRFPVGEHPGWTGTVTGLRLDLVSRRRPFLVERLRAVSRTGPR